MLEFVTVLLIIYFVVHIVGYTLFVVQSFFYPFGQLFRRYFGTTFKWNDVLVNNSDVGKWYLTNVKRQKRYLFIRLFFSFFTIIGFFLMLEYDGIRFYKEYGQLIENNFFKWMSNEDFLLFEIYLQLFIILIVISIVIYFLINRLNVRIDEYCNNLKRLNEDNELTRFVLALKDKMDIKEDVVVTYAMKDISNSNQATASVIKKNKINYLVLTPGAMILYKRNQLQFESLMVHELSHVKQGDSNFWLITEIWLTSFHKKLLRFIPFTLIIFLPMAFRDINLLYHIILTDAFKDEEWGVLIAIPLCKVFFFILVIILIDFLVKMIIKTRQRSEELADTASIIYSSGYALRDYFATIIQQRGSMTINDQEHQHYLTKYLYLQFPFLTKIEKFVKSIELKIDKIFKIERGNEDNKKEKYEYQVHPNLQERIKSLELKLNKMRITA